MISCVALGQTEPNLGVAQIPTLGKPSSKLRMLYPTLAAEKKQPYGPFTFSWAPEGQPIQSLAGLIVLSHGSGGSMATDYSVARAFAKAGFVVAQMLHDRDNYQDSSHAGPQSWKTRPQEISNAIDTIEQHAYWGSKIDTKAVAVHGMSAGGATAMMMAGAQWSIKELSIHCHNNLEHDLDFCLYGTKSSPEEQLARKQSFQAPESADAQLNPARENPQAIEAHRPDPRVVSVSALVPVGAIFTSKSLSQIQIPVGLVRAGQDRVLNPQWHTDHLLQHAPSAKLLHHNEHSTHFDWLSPWPDYLAKQIQAQFFEGGKISGSINETERAIVHQKLIEFHQNNIKQTTIQQSH